MSLLQSHMTARTLNSSEDDKVEEQPLCRPRTAKFLWYCYGGSLSAEHRTWVLHDVTCRTWVVRHFARWAMIALPVFVLLMALLPTPLGTRLFTGVAVSGGIFMFALVNILIDTDRRAIRAGYSYNRPGEIRGSSADDRQRTSNRERRERRAERQIRRGR